MDFPAEIYIRIFGFLDRRERYQSIFVCKEWSYLAVQAFYRNLELERHHITQMKSRLLSEKLYTPHFQFVQSLTICQKVKRRTRKKCTRIYFTRQEFLKLLSYLLNLKSIKIYDYKVVQDSCNFLLDVSLPNLKEMKILKQGNYRDKNSLYHRVYYHFCNSLEYLEIVNPSRCAVFTGNGGILNYLSNFGKLTDLNYFDNTDESVTIYQLQVACSSLKRINVTRSFKPLLVHDDTLFCLKTLEELTLNLSTLSANCVELITESLPTSIKKLKIALDNTYLFDWINSIGINTILKFIKHLNEFENVEITFARPNGPLTLHQNYNSNMTIFYRLIHAFKGEKKVHCSGNFDDVNPWCYLLKFSKGNLEFGYSLKEQYTSLFIENLCLPDKTVSIVGPEIINHLKFNFFSSIVDSPYKILKYSFDNCPYLHHLEIRYLTKGGNTFYLSNDTCFKLPKKKLNPLATSQEILKTIKLIGIKPFQKLLDLIHAYLPNIHSFICEDRYIINSRYETNVSREWTVDLSKFKELDIFYFDAQLILKNPFMDLFYIMFNYTDGENMGYSCITNEYMDVNLAPPEFLKANSKPIIHKINFKCKKINRFVIYNHEDKYAMEFNQGHLQESRALDNTDHWYITM